MSSPTKIPSYYNGWLPSTKALHKAFLKKLHGAAHEPLKSGAAHTFAVERFAEAIKSSEEMVQLFNDIFLQQAQIPELEHVCYFIHLVVRPRSVTDFIYV